MTDPILSVRNLKVYFPIKSNGLFSRKKWLRAVDNVSFDVFEGETLGIVGESGCGKSTLGRGILDLLPIKGGQVLWLGQNITNKTPSAMRPLRKDLQIIFQDPLASLNPRMTIGKIIAEPLRVHFPKVSKEERRKKVFTMMQQVGLKPEMLNRYPHEFSGGQNQRVGIARAMITNPKLIVCDESVSALDVSIQAQVINLLKDLQKKLNLTLVFISHDLSIVRHISHRVMVLYLGNIMEIGSAHDVYTKALHPYTQALISAIPNPDPENKNQDRIILEGDLPSPISPPSGCVFRTRCMYYKKGTCDVESPLLRSLDKNNHQVACHYPLS